MNRIVLRQLKKFLGIESEEAIPEELKSFVMAVSETYDHFDEDRKLIERSLDLSSKELTEANSDLKNKVREMEEQRDQLEKLNKVMVGRELKMIELKKEIEELRKSSEPDQK